MLVVLRPSHVRREPHNLTEGELAGRVYRLARCAGSSVDPDDWFPLARDVTKARDQAAHAIAVCARCPVRPDCLELSLQHAFGAGSHGVWGGSRTNRIEDVHVGAGPSSSAAGLFTLPMAAMIVVCAPLSGRIVGARGPRLPSHPRMISRRERARPAQ